MRARRIPRYESVSVKCLTDEREATRTYLNSPSSNRDLDIDQLLQALEMDVEGSKNEDHHQNMHV